MRKIEQKKGAVKSADTTPAQRRRAREKAEHRRAILEAAEQVFSEKGFAGTSIEDVARRAEFSVGALYNFFPGKDALFGAVMEKIAEDFFGAFQAICMRQMPPRAVVRALMELRFRSLAEHARFFRLLADAKPGARVFPDHAVPPACRRLYDDYLGKLAELLKSAMAAGVVQTMDAMHAALVFEGLVNAFSAYWSRQGVFLPLEQSVTIVEAVFWKLMSGRKEKPDGKKAL